MANPDYATLLGQIASTPAGDARDALIAQCYIFNEPLTAEEEQLFDYMNKEYVENNPATVDGVFKSYVGSYYSDTGERS